MTEEYCFSIKFYFFLKSQRYQLQNLFVKPDFYQTVSAIFESSLLLIWPRRIIARKSRMILETYAFSSDLHGCSELQVRLHAARNRLSIQLFVCKWHPAANIRPKTNTCRYSHNWCLQITMRLNRLIRLALYRINEA